jgi:site-specific recombinase XerD
VFGRVRLNEIKRQQVQKFLGDILQHGISPATADHHVKLIRQMLNRAVEWEVISSNPVTRIKLFNPDNRKENYLESAELQQLLEVLNNDANRGVCNVALFLLSTGARLNEALTATWDQIDKANRVWRIPATTSKSKRIRAVPPE